MREAQPRFRLHQDGRSILLTPGLNDEELREGQILFEVQSAQGGPTVLRRPAALGYVVGRRKHGLRSLWPDADIAHDGARA